jgi:hypothetical protein
MLGTSRDSFSQEQVHAIKEFWADYVYPQAAIQNSEMVRMSEAPYSVVDGMSLGYIYETSTAMIAIF